MTTKLKAAPLMTTEQEERFVAELYENFPEASQGSSLRCIGWKYAEDYKTKVWDRDRFKFIFEDEDGKKYTVRIDKAVKGLSILVHEVMAGKLNGLGFRADFLTEDAMGDWDGNCIDALAQCAVFGEVIYG